MTTLEKIKTEIEEARYGLINDGLDVALQIIDKYAEQEQMMEHYKKLAEHYNGGAHESIQDTNDGK